MVRKTCILLLLLPSLSPVCGRLWNFAFYTGSSMRAWKDAQAFCREHHTDLVTIRNKQDQAFVSTWGWIGLYREDEASQLKWSKGDKMTNYTNWDADEPGIHGACVFVHYGKWRIGDCGDNRSFTCYDQKLVLVNETKTWEEALNHCRFLDAGDTEDPASPYWNHRYDLATLITPEDHTDAREIAQEATTDEVWTGLRYLGGEWLWVDGQQMQYKDIPKCPTDGSCGVLEKKGTAAYGLRDCQLRRNFFCFKRR